MTSDKQIRKKIEKEFAYIGTKVSEMRAEAENMGADARDRFNKEIDGLKARADRLRADFEENKEGGALAALKEKYDQGLNELKDAFKNMRDRFR